MIGHDRILDRIKELNNGEIQHVIELQMGQDSKVPDKEVLVDILPPQENSTPPQHIDPTQEVNVSETSLYS